MTSSLISLRALGAGVLGAAIAAGCSGGPCHGDECAEGSMGTGNFVPGPLPHSAARLDGARCARSAPTLEIFLSNLFTQPDPPAPVRVTDALTVYWSVCNTGNGVVSPATPGAYDFVLVRKGDGVELGRESLDVAELDGCACEVVARSFNDGAGGALAAGAYEFSLDRLFDADVDRVIAE